MKNKEKDKLLTEVKKLRTRVAELEKEETKRKCAVEEIAKSKMRYKKLFDEALSPIFLINPETNIIEEVNPPCLELTGYKKEELIGSEFAKIVPEDKAKINKMLEKAEEEEGFRITSKTILTRKGEKKFIDATFSYYVYDSKQLIQLIAKDITERKKAEEGLKAANQQLMASEQQLKAANQQLTANEQQLKASNQQLTASEQQLKASNQQLTASEQQLKATNRELMASDLELKKNQTRLYKVQEITKVGFLDWQFESDEMYLSDSVIELYKLEQEKNWKTNEFVANTVHPGDMDRAKKNLELLVEGQTPNDIDHRVITGDGKVIWVHAKHEIIHDKEGKPKGLLGTVIDITDRKLFEQQLAIRNRISDIFLTAPNEKIFAETLHAILEILESKDGVFGYIDEDGALVCPSMISGTLDQCQIPDNGIIFPREVWGGIWGSALTEKKTFYTNKPFNMPEGHIPILRALDVPLIYGSEIIGNFLVGNKTTDYGKEDCELLETIANYIAPILNARLQRDRQEKKRKQAEEKLITAKEKAEESDRLKSAFLANMSHEIRTPMNGIYGFTNLLREPKLTGEEQQEYIDIIQKSGDRMLNTVDDLIDISRIETGLVKISVSKTDINEQIEELNRFFAPEAEKKGIELFYKKSLPAEEATIETDKSKFNSVLSNLVKNAIKYTEEGSIEFGYKKKKEFLIFYVKDTGIGIPENRQEAIFKRFEQADIEDKRVYEGFGLGLAISKSYVEMLDGKIWVESEEGKGSEFYFTVPYKVSEKETKEPVTVKRQESRVKNLKILIAEDEELAHTYLSVVVKKISKETLHAKTGVETVELCRKNKDIDLVLMDIRMPQMDGYEATRKIREFNKDVIIIAQTAHALTGDREKTLEAGCDDYIAKPIGRNELLEKIEKHFSE